MKQLLTGPAGCGKTHRILNEFVEALQKAADPLAQDHFLLLPSSEHVERVTTIMLQRGLPGFFYHRITTLSDFIRLQFGVGEVKLASSAMRFMILKEILASQSWPAFEEVQQSPGFLNLMLQEISELKDALLSTEDYHTAMNQLKRLEPELASKYESLARIYELYEERLQTEGFCDRQDLFKVFRKRKQAGDFSKRRFQKIWLDGFFDFSTLQMEYLRDIASYTENMMITLTKDEGYGRERIFDAAIRTEKSLRELGFQTEVIPSHNYRATDPSLQFLERNIFLERKKSKILTPALSHGEREGIKDPLSPQGRGLGEGTSIRIFEAVGMEGEVEMIAREILRTVKASGIRFSDIAVLLRQIGNYEAVIHAVFERYGIPVEIHERSRVKLSPQIQPVLSLIRIFQEDWKREDLFNFLKSSYVRQIRGQEKSLEWICRLEHESLRRGVCRGREMWLKPWDGFKSLDEESFFHEEKIRVLGVLASLEDQFKTAGKITDYETLLLKGLEGFGIVDSLTPTLSRRERENTKDSFSPVGRGPGEGETLRRDRAAFQRIRSVLEEIRTYYRLRGRQEMDFSSFAEHFLKLLEIDLYSVHHHDKNRVQVYGISLARQKEYRMVFVAGLLEKSFPLLIREDPILSDWERRLFNAHASRKLGERLIRQSIERYFFYLAVTRAQDQVILTYPKIDREGKEALPSFYVEELTALFDGEVPVFRQDLSHPYPRFSEVMTERELNLSVMGALWHAGDGEESTLTELTRYLAQQPQGQDLFRRIQVEIRAEIQDPKILQGDFFRISKTSASRLEEYAKCPYKYFSHRVLKLTDPEEDQNVMRKGIILHHVLETFFKYRLKQGRLFSDRETKIFIERELEHGIRQHPLIYEKPYQFELACEELRDMLLQFLPAELGRLEGSLLQPRYLEFGFGAGDVPDAPAYELEIEPGFKIQITGKIDRIDTDKDGLYALVLDYKRSAEFKKQNLDLGVALQLPLYLRAVEKFLGLKPIGGELYSIREFKAKGFYHQGHAEGLKELSSRSLKLAAPDFDQMMERSFDFIRLFAKAMKKSRIPVKPRACDSFCPYPAVCRIEKWRLEEILDEIKEEDKKRENPITKY
ncbi:MAG: hypothetical protein EXS63_05340 [Candidatus Omnitrophica bacterium]|nr:hypothetical protein [Candidatus Omnitrophota bacterium]